MVTSVNLGVNPYQSRRELTSAVRVAANNPSTRSYGFLRCTKVVNSPGSLSAGGECKQLRYHLRIDAHVLEPWISAAF